MLQPLVGYVLQEFNRRSRWASAAFMFVALNGSTLLAWSDALRGRFQVTWDRSDKEQKVKIVRPLLFVVMSAGLFYALLGNIPIHSVSRFSGLF